MDDILFHKLAEKKEFCEELLQVILNNRDLEVVEYTPQKSLRNIGAKSVVVDLLCEDAEKNFYNVEVQKSNDDDHQKRVRYNSSNIDTYIAEKESSIRI